MKDKNGEGIQKIPQNMGNLYHHFCMENIRWAKDIVDKLADITEEKEE